jgi:hypothetical protein
MGVNTQKYIRKPLYVDAVRVTAQNFDEIVAWCQGEVLTEEVEGTGTTKKFIKVRVHNPKNPRQTKAFIGDWLLYTERGYKVYTNKAFRGAFDLVGTEEPIAYPHEDGDTIVLGPQCFVAVDGSVLSWQGRNYVPQGVSEELPAAPAVLDEHATPEGEPHEYVEATPQAIADTVNEQQPPVEEVPPTTPAVVPPEVAPQPEPISEQAPEDAAAGKYVISEKEQAELGPDGVRELVSTGEAILAQDLAESA